MLSLHTRCSTDEPRCYRCTRDVQRMIQDAIVIHEMFNELSDMVSLYIRCSTAESRYKKFNVRAEMLSLLHEDESTEVSRDVSLPQEAIKHAIRKRHLAEEGAHGSAFEALSKPIVNQVILEF
ncbi:hypothetical protein Tco_0788602 [Tanacetum coccineum]